MKEQQVRASVVLSREFHQGLIELAQREQCSLSALLRTAAEALYFQDAIW